MRRYILARFLNCPAHRVQICEYGANIYRYNSIDYMILTQQEANEEAKRHIWSFLPSIDIDLIIRFLPPHISKDELSNLLINSCENCLLILSRLMPNYELFTEEAITKYGRSYFICFDHKEEYIIKHKEQDYYIYLLG